MYVCVCVCVLAFIFLGLHVYVPSRFRPITSLVNVDGIDVILLYKPKDQWTMFTEVHNVVVFAVCDSF